MAGTNLYTSSIFGGGQRIPLIRIRDRTALPRAERDGQQDGGQTQRSDKTVWKDNGGQRDRRDLSGRQADGTAGPQRLRQIHNPVYDRGTGERHGGGHLFRQPGRDNADAGKAEHRTGFPELRAVPPYVGGGEYRLSPDKPEASRNRQALYPGRMPPGRGGNRPAGTDRGPSQAQARTAPSPGPWSSSRTYCCWTSR